MTVYIILAGEERQIVRVFRNGLAARHHVEELQRFRPAGGWEHNERAGLWWNRRHGARRVEIVEEEVW